MDTILARLQGQSFHLSESEYSFLSNRYEELKALPVPELNLPDVHPQGLFHLISLHRDQLRSEEYIQSRITHPTTGTVDHLHAEITASLAVELGRRAGYEGYALELLRAAGHLHDSDRSFPATMIRGEEDYRHDPALYREYKKKHVQSSCGIVEKLTAEVNRRGFSLPDELISDLNYLVLRHETGGETRNGTMLFTPSRIERALNLDALGDLVMTADSIAYLDANILTNWEESGKDTHALSNKVHFMFDRMSREGKALFHEKILTSPRHILGPNGPKEPDITAIRGILLEVCEK